MKVIVGDDVIKVLRVVSN